MDKNQILELLNFNSDVKNILVIVSVEDLYDEDEDDLDQDEEIFDMWKPSYVRVRGFDENGNKVDDIFITDSISPSDTRMDVFNMFHTNFQRLDINSDVYDLIMDDDHVIDELNPPLITGEIFIFE